MIAPRKCEREGLDLPDEDWCHKLRTELGALHQGVAALALERCERVVDAQWDATPWGQREYQTTQYALEDTTPVGVKRRRMWCGAGAYEIADQSGAGEARAVKEQLFETFAETAKRLHAAMERKHGKAVADAAIDTKKGGITLRKLVGAVLATDNASAALTSQTELMKLVRQIVKDDMGDEWDKLTPAEQAKLVKVW